MMLVPSAHTVSSFKRKKRYVLVWWMFERETKKRKKKIGRRNVKKKSRKTRAKRVTKKRETSTRKRGKHERNRHRRLDEDEKWRREKRRDKKKLVEKEWRCLTFLPRSSTSTLSPSRKFIPHTKYLEGRVQSEIIRSSYIERVQSPRHLTKKKRAFHRPVIQLPVSSYFPALLDAGEKRGLWKNSTKRRKKTIWIFIIIIYFDYVEKVIKKQFAFFLLLF